MLHKHTLEAARKQIRRTGERVTAARVHALGVLLKRGHALSHHDIELQLQRAGAVDRVTLYRVLDWLVEKGLAHRICGADRIWRFSIAGAERDEHAHFHCEQCGKTLCLDRPMAPKVRLPRGYRCARLELTVQGLCADCN